MKTLKINLTTEEVKDICDRLGWRKESRSMDVKSVGLSERHETARFSFQSESERLEHVCEMHTILEVMEEGGGIGRDLEHRFLFLQGVPVSPNNTLNCTTAGILHLDIPGSTRGRLYVPWVTRGALQGDFEIDLGAATAAAEIMQPSGLLGGCVSWWCKVWVTRGHRARRGTRL